MASAHDLAALRAFDSAGPVEAPPPAPSGVRLRMPMVLIVGLTDECASACRRALLEEDVGLVRVSHGIAAGRAIAGIHPTIVAVASSLWSDELRAVRSAAYQVGAQVIELPPGSGAAEIAPVLARAARSAR